MASVPTQPTQPSVRNPSAAQRPVVVFSAVPLQEMRSGALVRTTTRLQARQLSVPITTLEAACSAVRTRPVVDLVLQQQEAEVFSVVATLAEDLELRTPPIPRPMPSAPLLVVDSARTTTPHRSTTVPRAFPSPHSARRTVHRLPQPSHTKRSPSSNHTRPSLWKSSA